MVKEKPAYKLTWKEAIPFCSSRNYNKRNRIALEKGDKRSRFMSKEYAPRFALTAFYDINVWLLAIGNSCNVLEKIFE